MSDQNKEKIIDEKEEERKLNEDFKRSIFHVIEGTSTGPPPIRNVNVEIEDVTSTRQNEDSSSQQ